MTVFRYKAVSPAGQTVEGEMDAPSETAVVARLHEMGHIPVRAQPTKHERASFGPGFTKKHRGLSPTGTILFARELATLLGSGLPLDRSLKILVELSDQKGMRRILSGILERVKGGASLADAVASEKGAFPSYFIGMIRAAEAGGSLDKVLLQVSDYMERMHTAAENVRSALIYPIILLVTAGLSIVVLMTLVVPQFQPLFEDAGQALPMATRVVVGTANWLQSHWPVLIGGFCIAALLFRFGLRDASFRLTWHRLLLGAPLFGNLILKIEVARFGRTLGTLLGNGVTLLNAMNIARDVHSNSFMANTVGGLADGIRQGQGLAAPLEQGGLFPGLAVHLIRIGEESGKLDEMLLHVAEIFERDAQRTIDRLLAMLVPALTIGLGAFIAGIIASVLVAIMSINKLAF